MSPVAVGGRAGQYARPVETDPLPVPPAAQHFDVSVEVAAPTADVICGRLWTTAPTAILAEDVAAGRVRLTASYPSRAQAEAAATVALAGMEPTVRPSQPTDWQRVNAGAAPVFVGEHRLVMDPGPTFGWGGHPSTLLALDWLAASPPTGARVLDVGCGSGVLAVAAALLGASRVRAVDIDPVAARVTQANARTHGVASVVMASCTPVARLHEEFDVVVANLAAPEQLELAPELRRLGRNGVLCLSGFLSERVSDVLAAHWPRSVSEQHELEGWAAVVIG